MKGMKGQLDVSSPEEYIESLEEPRRTEIAIIDRFIQETVPGLQRMIHSGMIGYGPYHYKYASGREGDWCRVFLASNKQYISIYACATDGCGYIAEQNKAKLGKASVGKSCIRFKKFDDLNKDGLREVLVACIQASEESS
jgi:hypothetical protein